MRKKILITGANGFVGFHLVNCAIAKGLEVYAGVREGSDISHLENINVSVTYLKYDEVDALTRDFQSNKYDYIVHNAGITKAKNDADYERVNAMYSRNVALAAQTINPEKVVFISSLAALGPVSYGEDVEILDDADPKPVTVYGRSKLNAENYIKEFADLRWNIIRPTAVYGPREKDLLLLIKTINKGFEIYLGRSKQSLSFIHAEDLAEVILQACFTDKTQRCYNISDGKRYNTQKLSEIIKNELGKKTVKITIPISILKFLAVAIERFAKGKTSILNKDKVSELTAENWYCNIDRAKEELGFSPKYDLESGMKNTIEWYKIKKWI